MPSTSTFRATPLLAALALLSAIAITGASAPGTKAGEDEARFREAARLRSLALADMEEGNFARAAERLEALAEILPDNVLPPVDLAICYFRLDRPEDALAQLRRAEALAPDNPNLLYTLARVLELEPGRRAEWERAVGRFAAAHPDDPRPWFLRARRLDSERRFAEAVPLLERALERDPENLVLMVELLAAAAEARDPETAGAALDAIEDRLDGFDPGTSVAEYAGRLRELLAAGEAGALRPPAFVLRNLLRPTDLYQLGLVPLTGGGPAAASQMFPQLDFDPPLPKSVQGGQDIEIAFADATAASALAPPAGPLLVDRRPDSEGLLGLGGGAVVRIAFAGGRFAAERQPLAPPPGGVAATEDFDQDHVSDLVTAGADGTVVLYRGLAAGGFAAGEKIDGPRPGGAVAGLFPLDADHDGDLDLFVARAGAADLFLRNDGGGWSERAAELGLSGPEEDTGDLAVADFDDDGDLDLLTIHPHSHPRLYLNRRSGAFAEAGASAGLDRAGPGHARATTADFDRDGAFDLLLWGEGGGALLLNRGGSFEPAALAGAPARWSAAAAADFDNDGDQDVAIAAPGGRLVLARNRRERGFTVEGAGPEAGGTAAGTSSLLAGDFDDDGDLDLVAAAGSGAARFLRNDGGNRNHWVRLSLVGRTDNNGKNPSRGLFSRIEARLGDDFQVVLGNGGVNHLGLGARRQADVVRVVWTNGLAQTWQRVAADRTMVEEQVLKGSCPFLYAWNGREFAFVTDLMWKSPLGMVLADGRPAPHQSARDFVLVPGEALVPSGGELWLQTTEELWETAYVDRQSLFAVDRPAGIELVVDESFRPPPYPEAPPIHWVGRRLAPAAARDGDGRDVLEEILARDGRHVDRLPLGRYQGLTGGQRLELTFEGVPAGERLRLLLWGWIFPTDTSINRALSQDSRLAPAPPALEARGPDGGWRRVADFIGFPNGKRKGMVVELEGLLESEGRSGGRLELAIPTSMQIYWDAAALAVGDPAPPARITRLEPRAADLHYRGYSRLYRESPSGPHLFDYARVATGPRFRDMAGRFTRFGPVEELLAAEDDRYVVMNAGDELTVRFDAAALPALPPGWRRDWVLYTDGWVKDADINTLHSGTVEPLPYHAMTAYPDRPRHRFPNGAEHRAWRERYQTREVGGRPFREALSGGRPPGPRRP